MGKWNNPRLCSQGSQGALCRARGQNSGDKTHTAAGAEESARSRAACMMDVKRWQGKLCRNEFGSAKANKEGSVKGKKGHPAEGFKRALRPENRQQTARRELEPAVSFALGMSTN